MTWKNTLYLYLNNQNNTDIKKSEEIIPADVIPSGKLT